jgi:hypothetical protein
MWVLGACEQRQWRGLRGTWRRRGPRIPAPPRVLAKCATKPELPRNGATGGALNCIGEVNADALALTGKGTLDSDSIKAVLLAEVGHALAGNFLATRKMGIVQIPPQRARAVGPLPFMVAHTADDTLFSERVNQSVPYGAGSAP